MNLEPKKMILKTRWNLWTHSTRDRNWNIDSYQNIYEFETIDDVLKITLNFDKFGIKHQHFFIMRSGIKPIWEDVNNREGSTCSFRTEIEYVGHNESIPMIELWEYLIFCTLGETLLDDNSIINGISLTPKNNWAIIKIWSKNKNDLTETLKNKLKNKFNNLSVKYKPFIPEY